mmetsp:Transcript_26261/g.87041  ORF Transcript_26261/g.87041 Transcript_26261/m.87041 type:complete len:145 (-) Transcript_26261:417-851(-)
MDLLSISARFLDVAGFLVCQDVMHVALARTTCLSVFRPGKLWRFSTLLLDGAKGCNPHGVFHAVATHDIVSLRVSGRRYRGGRGDAEEAYHHSQARPSQLLPWRERRPSHWRSCPDAQTLGDNGSGAICGTRPVPSELVDGQWH